MALIKHLLLHLFSFSNEYLNLRNASFWKCFIWIYCVSLFFFFFFYLSLCQKKLDCKSFRTAIGLRFRKYTQKIRIIFMFISFYAKFPHFFSPFSLESFKKRFYPTMIFGYNFNFVSILPFLSSSSIIYYIFLIKKKK